MRNSKFIRKIFARIVAATIATVIISSVATYYFVLYQTAEDSLAHIKRYTEQRINYENKRFDQVQQNHQVIRNELVEKLTLLGKKDPIERYQELVVENKDGSLRSPINKFNTDIHALTFIQKDLNVDAELRRRVVAINEVVNQYGDPWHHRFENLYVTSINKIGVLFWPEKSTIIFDLPADQNLSEQDAIRIANIQNNPDRKTVWTNLYRGYISEKWATSVSTPVDMDGHHIATITNDIFLDELLLPLNDQRQNGIINMVVHPDGKLIMHSHKMDDIKAHQGSYDINSSNDEHLKEIFRLIYSNKDQQVVIRNNTYNEFLAIGLLEKPGWYFVTVYPNSIISKTAINAAVSTLIVNAISAFILLFIINTILFSGITERFEKIIRTVKKITKGEVDLIIETDSDSDDEITDLAISFNQMSQSLLKQREQLGERVLQRTEQLAYSEKRFRTIFETMQDAYAQVNADGKIVLVNQAALDVLGYDTFDEVYQLETIHNIYNVSEERDKLFKELQQKGQIKEREVQLKKKDGSIIICEVDMVLIYDEYGKENFSLGLLRDISKRLSDEQQQLKYSKELEDLLDYIPLGYVSYGNDGKITNCNNKALSILGFNKNNLIGKRPQEFCVNISKEEIARLQNLLSEGKPIKGEELQIKRANGDIIWIRITVQPEFGSHSRRTMFEDISDRKKIEIELTVAMHIAEEANAAKSTFLSQMSHELRTPLNAILGFAQIFEMDAYKLDDEQVSNINEIKDAGQHLLLLIEDILDIAKIESGKLDVVITVVNLDNVISESLSLIKPKADETEIIIINHIQQELLVLADPIRLKQVILNLLTNAIKYNSIPGRIRLESEVIDKQNLRISIIDTGKGLSSHEMSQLFVPFERLSHVDDIEGTGIGLVISKHLIEAMDGSVGVTSDSGTRTGCEFWIEIPLSHEA